MEGLAAEYLMMWWEVGGGAFRCMHKVVYAPKMRSVTLADCVFITHSVLYIQIEMGWLRRRLVANANKLIHHYVAETATSTSCSTFVFDPLGNSIENASIEMGDDDDSMLRCGVRFDENILLNDNKVVITIIKVCITAT